MAGLPVQFRTADGNINDPITLIKTWNTQQSLAERPDFRYVADSKLCSDENLDTIARAGERFVTVLPRSRQEDRRFRKRLQTTTPPMGIGLGPPGPPGQGWSARSMVSLPRPDRLDGDLADRVGVVQAPHWASPRQPPAPHRCRHRGARRRSWRECPGKLRCWPDAGTAAH